MNDVWIKKIKKNAIPWLLESEPWTQYNTLVDLCGISKKSNKLKRIKETLNKSPAINTIIKEAMDWFPISITIHSKATIWHYKLLLLAELGLDNTNVKIQKLISKVKKHTENDLFAVRQVLPEKGVAFSKDRLIENNWYALPCDSPLILYSLYLMGEKDQKIKKAIKSLKNKWQLQDGWFCDFPFVSSLRKRYKEGCPMAGLMALQAFSLIPELKESKYAINCYRTIKSHFDYGKKVYFFGLGKKFWTLKYPFIWYNALYLGDVLSKFNFCKQDYIMRNIINWIIKLQDEQGRFTPTSMFRHYKEWDFGNKKTPSPWITFLCYRILKRYFG